MKTLRELFLVSRTGDDPPCVDSKTLPSVHLKRTRVYVWRWQVQYRACTQRAIPLDHAPSEPTTPPGHSGSAQVSWRSRLVDSPYATLSTTRHSDCTNNAETMITSVTDYGSVSLRKHRRSCPGGDLCVSMTRRADVEGNRKPWP